MFGLQGPEAGNIVCVRNPFPSNVRSYWHGVNNGHVVITDHRPDGKKVKVVIGIKDATIATQSIREDGKLQHFIEYGKMEKTKKSLLRFRKGTNRGLDGLSLKHDEEIFHTKSGAIHGTCKTLYKRGRMIWQKFYHDGTKKLAYHFRPLETNHVIRYRDGKVACEITGRMDCRGNSFSYRLGDPIFRNTPSPTAFREETGQFIRYDEAGKILDRGEYRQRQQVGEWIINGEKVYFIRGLQVSAKMYDTPPEKLDPKKVMAIKDIDTRSIFIERVGVEKILKAFNSRVIHRENGMSLHRMAFPKRTRGAYNILQVTCPSTKEKYYLRVPRMFTKCEDARQWTFGVEEIRERIKFDIET